MSCKVKNTEILLLIPCSYVLPLVPFFFFSFWYMSMTLTSDGCKEIKSNLFFLNFPTSKN